MSHDDRNKLEYAGVVSAEQAAEYFQTIADGMREHAMLLESGNSSVTLGVPGDVKLALQVSAGHGKSSIELALTWQDQATPAARPALRVVTADDFERPRSSRMADTAPGGDGAETAKKPARRTAHPARTRTGGGANGVRTRRRSTRKKPAA
jgi:amphi-Trp domain-containing protein